jgi:rubrerythrin
MNAEEYRKIISTAIDKEVESYTFYKSTADKAKDPAMKKLFNELAGEEKTHREILQGFLSKDVKMLHFDAAHDYKVVDDSGTPKLSADMKPVDGLVLAIKKELAAMQMYTQFAKASANPEQRMVFEQLATMERGHKARLEDIYVNMAMGESW